MHICVILSINFFNDFFFEKPFTCQNNFMAMNLEEYVKNHQIDEHHLDL